MMWFRPTTLCAAGTVGCIHLITWFTCLSGPSRVGVSSISERLFGPTTPSRPDFQAQDLSLSDSSLGGCFKALMWASPIETRQPSFLDLTAGRTRA